jgi:prophage regulatory protein
MKLLTFKQLGSEKGIPYSRDHWRRKCAAGECPRPIAVSDRRVAWIESEIDEWLADRAAERDAAARETAAVQPDAGDPPFEQLSRAPRAEKTRLIKRRTTLASEGATA